MTRNGRFGATLPVAITERICISGNPSLSAEFDWGARIGFGWLNTCRLVTKMYNEHLERKEAEANAEVDQFGNGCLTFQATSTTPLYPLLEGNMQL